MFGMSKVLTEKRIDVIEFEYNRKWKATLRSPRPMGPFVEWLNKRGYLCFWQGNSGELAQLSAPCYVEDPNPFGFPRSNAVCSYRHDIITAFQACKTLASCTQ